MRHPVYCTRDPRGRPVAGRGGPYIVGTGLAPVLDPWVERAELARPLAVALGVISPNHISCKIDKLEKIF